MHSFFKDIRRAERGFTLVELLVVIAIFALVTTIVFARQSQFSGSTLLTNVAYQVALTLRQAQVYGLSVREFSSSQFNFPYGVHFDKSGAAGGSGQALNTMIVFFVDSSATPPVANPQIRTTDFSNCGESNNSCLELLTMNRGNHISDLCAKPSGGSSCSSVDTLDISFVRPDPEARIVSISGVAVEGNNSCARITLSPVEGPSRYVIVTNTGQISVSSSITSCQ